MAAPNEKFIKAAQGAESELNCGPTQTAASEKTKIAAKIIALQGLPVRFVSSLVFEPAKEFKKGLAIITLSVDRCPAIRRQMLKEILDPLIVDRRFIFVGFRFHLDSSRASCALRQKRRRSLLFIWIEHSSMPKILTADTATHKTGASLKFDELFEINGELETSQSQYCFLSFLSGLIRNSQHVFFIGQSQERGVCITNAKSLVRFESHLHSSHFFL